jgi:hypothetical protein
MIQILTKTRRLKNTQLESRAIGNQIQYQRNTYQIQIRTIFDVYYYFQSVI